MFAKLGFERVATACLVVTWITRKNQKLHFCSWSAVGTQEIVRLSMGSQLALPVKKHSPESFHINEMARPEGIEPPTLCLEGRCSLQLSYGRAVRSTSSCSVYCILAAGNERASLGLCPILCPPMFEIAFRTGSSDGWTYRLE